MDFVEELREDFLMCNICFEEYREPKQLPCLHTFCRHCLSMYIVGKVVETGAEWFPCPFCRKCIQPTQGGEVKTWADSFPTNFLLSQLRSKLEEKTAAHCEGHDDVTSGRDVTTRTKCPEHPQSYLVGYCTKQRRGVCEECSVHRHADCIRSHVRARDASLMAEERRAECQECWGALQIKLEGIQDTVKSRETDLAARTEHVTQQTEAVLSDIKAKFDLFLLQQKRDLSSKLDNFVGKEKTRITSVKDRMDELTKASQRVTKKLDSVGDGGLSVKDLVLLDKVQDELKRQEQVAEKLRKECFPVDLQLYPGDIVDKALKGLSVGSLASDGRGQTGARTRVHRYTSDPSASHPRFRDHDHRGYSEVSESHSPYSRRDRALSPPGGAASALSSSPSTADGPTSGEYDSHRDSRRRPEGPVTVASPRRTPLGPDFGAVLIEESRRSRSLPRRHRPLSDGARRRGVPMETAIDGSSENVRISERNVVRGHERNPNPLLARSMSENQATVVRPRRERGSSPRGAVSGSAHPSLRSPEPHSVSSDDDLSSSLENNFAPVTPAGASGGGGGANTISPAPVPDRDDERDRDGERDKERERDRDLGRERDRDRDRERDQDRDRERQRDRDGEPTSSDNETSSQSSRRIICVRYFQASHHSDVKSQPGLVGISAVARDRVAVSDRWNKVVKLLDIAGRVLDVLTVSGDAEPWDLALRRPGVLAITYPKEQKIRMVDVVDGASRLIYRSHFMTRDGYASLATHDSTSLVACVCPPFGQPKIHIIDYLGAVLRAVDCSNVAYPRCVDVCGGDEVCVSDWTHHNVKIFSRDGATTKYTYSGVPGAPGAQLKAPMGVACDGRGHVYIADGKTAKLHAVSTATGQCAAIFSLPQVTGAELKLVTFVEASPELCRSEKALVVTTTSGAVQVYDLRASF
ncbi:RING finger protein nhl-1-like [Littorina saxatilis]|uniref:RING-type domain-containing protein n=1 Tax=Littorina saxatilis TaxID=31220 RepID=A0AAN9AKI4_9CAEN